MVIREFLCVLREICLTAKVARKSRKGREENLELFRNSKFVVFAFLIRANPCKSVAKDLTVFRSSRFLRVKALERKRGCPFPNLGYKLRILERFEVDLHVC